MVLYTVLIGVLTAVMLAIKGVELLLIVRGGDQAVLTSISDANVDPNLDANANRHPVILTKEKWVV